MTTNEHLKQTQEALACLDVQWRPFTAIAPRCTQNGIESWRAPVAEDILKLRSQIDEYIGLHDPLLAEELAEIHSANGTNGAAIDSQGARHESGT